MRRSSCTYIQQVHPLRSVLAHERSMRSSMTSALSLSSAYSASSSSAAGFCAWSVRLSFLLVFHGSLLPHVAWSVLPPFCAVYRCFVFLFCFCFFQSERDRVLHDFKEGRSLILVATDVASRGLDVKDIHVVVNFDFPQEMEVHMSTVLHGSPSVPMRGNRVRFL